MRITLRDRPYSEQPDEDDAPVPPSPAAPPPPAAAVVAESREADREEAKAAAEQADREEAKGTADQADREEAKGTADQADRESRAPRSDRTLLESGDDLQEAVEDILSGLLDRMGFVGDFEIVSEDPADLQHHWGRRFRQAHRRARRDPAGLWVLAQSDGGTAPGAAMPGDR